MKQKLISISTFILIVLISCDNRTTVVTGEEIKSNLKEVTSINGDVIYTYNEDHSEVVGVQKYELAREGLEYVINIRRDTLRLGETFFGAVWGYSQESPPLGIQIYSPENKVLDINEGSSITKYSFVPDKVGTYIFAGTININNRIDPFEYKFIVVEK